jgi:hypothetical protein
MRSGTGSNQTFSCITYVKKTKPNISKLEDRSTRMVLLGVTTRPPKPHRPTLTRGGHTYTLHPAYTFILALCKRANPRVVWLVDKAL